MSIQQMVPGIYSVGSKDKHRLLFDQLMNLSEGTSYNAFLIKGSEKTALIDTVYPPCHEELISKLKELGIEKLDYIVANHGEQDHTGTLPELLALFPEAKIVTNQKCMDITSEFLPIDKSRYQIVAEGDVLSLGDKSLQFMMMPWVHWPDTMFAWMKEERILFTTDFFGAHMTNYDLFWDGTDSVVPLAKAYYSEIMMPYARVWQKYLDKVEALNPAIIAPSHGPVYKEPKFIIDLYRKWVSQKENKMILLSVSMYGSTDAMADYLQKQVEAKGIQVKRYDAVHLNVTGLANDLVDAKGIIVASPTVLTGPHPMVMEPLCLLNVLRPSIQYVGLIGSYSWGTQIAAQVLNLIPNLKTVPVLDPVLIKGYPKKDGFESLDLLANQIAEKHNA